MSQNISNDDLPQRFFKNNLSYHSLSSGAIHYKINCLMPKALNTKIVFSSLHFLTIMTLNSFSASNLIRSITLGDPNLKIFRKNH